MKNQEIKGTVEKITYRNNDNGYTVFKVKAGKEATICVGIVPVIAEGDTVCVSGSYVNHSVYGEQLSVETIEIFAPKTQLGILRYLSSGAIKGVGPATAMKIVERFKDRTLDIIENSPIDLTLIRGISTERALSISEEFKKQFGIRDIMLELAVFNITPVEAAKIFKQFGIYSVDIIKENPYILCTEEIGFPFDRVEDIAEKLEIPLDDDGRVSAGIIYVLRKNLSNAHTCLPYDKLVSVSENLLSVNRIMIEDSLKKLCDRMETELRQFNGEVFVYLKEYCAAEEYISAKIRAYSANNTELKTISEKEIHKLGKKLGIEFDKKQIEAVCGALKNNFFVMTGGPGTGKTTTLNALINIFADRGLSIALSAPTGRAAKRITEITGYEAKTLHRLLEVEWGNGDKQSFARNKKRPLDEDIIIIDEMSMVDTLLFKALLEASRISSRIILIGDSDQLPSVGAGNVLGDILASGKIANVRLERIFRQSDHGNIVSNAHTVISGKMPTINNHSDDFFFISNANPELAAGKIVELCSVRLPNAYGLSPIENIQVLSPSKKMVCGSYNLNIMLQSAINPPSDKKKELFFKGVSYRVGDKVMHIKNDYNIVWTDDNGGTGTGVFN